MKTIKIRQTNAPEIIFEGERIFAVSGRILNGRELTRWTDLNFYRTHAGKVVVERIFVNPFVGEFNEYRAKVCDSPQEVFDWLFSSSGALKPRNPNSQRDVVGKLRLTSQEWAYVHKCANFYHLTWSAFARCVLMTYKLPPPSPVRVALDVVNDLGNAFNSDLDLMRSAMSGNHLTQELFDLIVDRSKSRFKLLQKLKSLLEGGEDDD